MNCLWCEKEFDILDSVDKALEPNSEGDFDCFNYCSLECQKAEEDWFAEANKIVESAKVNNPGMFLRSNLSSDEEKALETIKQNMPMIKFGNQGKD